MFISIFILNLFGGLDLSPNSYTVYSFLYLIAPGSDLGSSYVATATDFLLGDVASCGHRRGHQPACTGFASYSAACKVHSDILIWQSKKSRHSTHTMWSQTRSHMEPRRFTDSGLCGQRCTSHWLCSILNFMFGN